MKPKNFFMSILASLAFLSTLILLITIDYQTNLRIINIFLIVCTGLLLGTIIFSEYIIKEVRLFFNLLSLILVILFGFLVIVEYDYQTLDILLIAAILILLIITLIKYKVLETESIKSLNFLRGFKENNLTKKINKVDNLLEHNIITEPEHQKMRKNIIDKYMK